MTLDNQVKFSAKDFAHAVGTPAKLIQLVAHRQSRALRGMSAARRVLVGKAA